MPHLIDNGVPPTKPDIGAVDVVILTPVDRKPILVDRIVHSGQSVPVSAAYWE